MTGGIATSSQSDRDYLDGRTIGFLGTIVAARAGAESATVVAMQCVAGHTWDTYLVFAGPLELRDRYDGMISAFGKDLEIFEPRAVGRETIPAPMKRTDFDKLVNAAYEKHESSAKYDNYNEVISQNKAMPVWNWASQKYGRLPTIIIGSLAFLPIAIVSIARLASGERLLGELWYALCFLVVATYTAVMLHTKREIHYIRVYANDVSSKEFEKWSQLYESAETASTPTADRAIQDLAKGCTQKEENALLVPVMALKPLAEYEVASWLLGFSPYRGPLLSSAFLLGSTIRYKWAIAYIVAGCIQANLHWLCTMRWHQDSLVQPKAVVWYRQMPSEEGYVMEQVEDPEGGSNASQGERSLFAHRIQLS